MKGPRLGPAGEDITWPDQVAPRGRRTPSTREVKPQTSNPITSPPGDSGTTQYTMCCSFETRFCVLRIDSEVFLVNE